MKYLIHKLKENSSAKSFRNPLFKLMFEPIIEYARGLRQKQTKAEEVIWNRLRNRKFYGYKFRRQHPISNRYILDFYCNEMRLAVEIDGDHHQNEMQKYDDDCRTNELKLMDIKVIRFNNKEVFNNIEEVLSKILAALTEKSCSPGAPLRNKV
jgi:very-short-patch-repair endonuclease